MTEAPAHFRSAEAATRADLNRSQLLAILFVDACGFSRATRRNEDAALRSIGSEISAIRELVADHAGALCSVHGDGLLATFGSAHDAVRCALAIHDRVPGQDSLVPIKFRAGVHIGEAYKVDDQILGDSVNVAARIEAAAEPGGTLVSRPVFEALRGRPDFDFESVGAPQLKNIGSDLELYRVVAPSRSQISKRFELQLVGPFSLIGPDGLEIAITREGQALLAAAALCHGNAVSREWLQNALWEGRTPGEREAGLQAALADLRQAFGEDASADVLRVDDLEIALVSGAVVCDVTAIVAHGWRGPGTLPDLLQDCEIEGKAFRDWLLHERSLLRNAVCLRDTESQAAACPILASQDVDVAGRPPMLFAIGLLPARTDTNDARAGFMADLLADWLIRSLCEVEALEIHDYRDRTGQSPAGSTAAASSGPDLMIQCRAATADELVRIAITVVRAEDRKLIWSQSVMADQSEFLGLGGESVAAFVSYATDALLSALASGRHMRDPAAHHAVKTAISAVHRLLTMTGPGLDRVEADIMAAYEIDPKPIYLAWLAYMATFHVGERYGARDAMLEEQARTLARKALESDQHNALVLGLVAHVHSYIFREFAFADDLISRALETNPLCSMSWDSASLLYSYTGRVEQAMRAAENARRLGRHSPYRHLFDGACCVAAAVNRRFDEAIGFGESVMAVQPQFKSVLRYLAASYGYVGDSERARTIMDRLIQLEPDLSVERLRDRSYPVPSGQSAKLIETGLSQVGLRKHP